MAQEVKDINQIPVPDEKRKRTDIFCTVCTGIFAGIIFIIAIACFNAGNLGKMTYPADGEGNLCGWDVPEYPLLYYTSLNDPVKRLCVKECPKKDDTELSCYATKSLSCSKNDNPKYEVQIYDSQLQHNRVGLFCWPTDETQKASLLQKSGLNDKYKFLAFYDAMWNSFWISVLFGIAYLVLVQCFPLKVVPWTFLVGGISFLILALLVLILPSGFILVRILVAVFFGGLGALCVYALLFSDEFRKAIILCSRLIECSTEVVKYDYKIFFYIPIFMIFFLGLVFLVAFQILGVWSVGELTFDPAYPFYSIGGFVSNLFSFFVFIEFFWGMAFLKQAFNFCVSGYATNWYYLRERNPFEISLLSGPTRMIKFHWGSVVGGSILLFVFYFVDLFLDFFTVNMMLLQGNDRDIKKRELEKSVFHRETEEYEEESKYQKKTISFFNLVRSQSFGYINLIPLPYCNASRYCEYMAQESAFYDRSQTVNRLFRLGAHCVIVFLVTIISVGTMKGSSGEASIVGMVFIMIISLFTITYFICLHADIAQGLLISIFTEEKLTDRVDVPPQSVKKVYDDDIRNRLEGENTIREVLIG